MKKFFIFAITVFVVMFFHIEKAQASKKLEGNVEKGKKYYKVCADCHGEKGAGSAKIHAPALAGQDSWYLRVQIKNFIAELRGKHPKDLYGKQCQSPKMTVTDEQAIEDVVAYISTFKRIDIVPTLEGNVVRGKGYYDKVCAICHLPNGKGQDKAAPSLLGQHDWYLFTQIQNFRDGIRGKDPLDVYGIRCHPTHVTLKNEQSVKDVALYIVSLSKKKSEDSEEQKE